MVYSMTGYSTGSVELPLSRGRSIDLMIEIKALNSRFFEMNCRLSPSLSFLEVEINQLLKRILIRGRVYATITPVHNDEEMETVVPLLSTAREYVRAIDEIKKTCNISGEISIGDLIRLPHVFSSERATVRDKTKTAILKEIEQAALQVQKRRLVEGAFLQEDLEERFGLCAKHITNIKKLSEEFVKKHKKVVSQLSVRAQKGDEEARQQLEDAYAMLNKIDVNEEITRFKSHLDKVKQVLTSKKEEKGRRLDFILQELVRETNTVAAKCSMYKISELCIDVKVELEKAREQVQNIL